MEPLRMVWAMLWGCLLSCGEERRPFWTDGGILGTDRLRMMAFNYKKGRQFDDTARLLFFWDSIGVH